MAGHFRKYGCKIHRPRCQRYGDSQASAKIAVWQDRLARNLDVATGFCCKLTECHARFRQAGASGGARKKLDTELRLDPCEPAADHRFGNPQSSRRGRDASGIGNFDKCPQIFDIHSLLLFDIQARPNSSCCPHDRRDLRAQMFDGSPHRHGIKRGRTHLEGDAVIAAEYFAGLHHLGCHRLRVTNKECALRAGHCVELLACRRRPSALPTNL